MLDKNLDRFVGMDSDDYEGIWISNNDYGTSEDYCECCDALNNIHSVSVMNAVITSRVDEVVLS